MVLLPIILAYPSSARSQNLEIFDRATEKRIENVAAFSTGKGASVISNRNGEVSLEAFQMEDTIIFQHPSYINFFYTKRQLRAMKYKVYLVRDVHMLKEVVLSASKTEEKREDIPAQMEIIDYRDVASLNPQTTADMLTSSGAISVQKSQMGGGSPVIRGFEANKVLLVVDGVRMNNAIYRSGHLQNVITIDHSVLERTEIVFGPSSVMYGSDALGGVMHFYTKRPLLAYNDSTSNEKINGYVRYSSANREKTTHFDFQVGFKKMGLLTSITHSVFGDLMAGTRHRSDYPEFGKLEKYYYKTTQGNDTMLVNAQPNLQRNTGYNQVNLTQKIFYRPNPNVGFTLNVQYSSSSLIPRYDKMNDLVDDTLKYAEWYYGPQERLFTALTTDLSSKTSFYDKGTVIFGYQKVAEERITRKFLNDLRTTRNELVDVLTFNADFFKVIDSVRSFQYGAELTYNKVMSDALTENIKDSTNLYAPTRYPDGGSDVQSAAAYLTYKWWLNKKMLLNAGLRYSQIDMSSRFQDTNPYNFTYDNIAINTSAFNGSAGLVLRPSPRWQFNVSTATGFRAPNVDDYGKVFAKDDYVVVPNPNLVPEYVKSAELSISRKFNDRASEIKLIGYYTYLTDAIVRRDFALNGDSTMVYDGDTLQVTANINANEAIIYGAFLGVKWRVSKTLSIESNINCTYGEDLTEKVPMSHIPPVFGKTALNYVFLKGAKLKPLKLSLYSHYNGWKRLSEYGSPSVDNLSEATENGMPAWYTINFNGSYEFKIRTPYYEQDHTLQEAENDRVLLIQLGIENIADTHYRHFASGISAPGRNFVITLRAYF